jgi:hypothetical protein
MRTLIKQGHPEALALLGFRPAEGVTVEAPRLSADAVAIGGELRFSATLSNTGAEPARLAIDYVVHHRKANGKTTPKVFKLTTRTLLPGETTTIERGHSFKVISTRVYYPGEHSLTLQVNGEPHGPTTFTLLPERTSGR